MSWPFSNERFFLYISCLAYSFIVIYLITYFFPYYERDTRIIFLAEMFIAYGAYLFSNAIGILQKVNQIEKQIYKSDLKKVYADYFNREKEKRNMVVMTGAKEIDVPVLTEFEKAHSSWKSKPKHKLTPIEEYIRTEYQFKILSIISKILRLLTAHLVGFYLLINPIYIFILFPIHAIIQLNNYMIYKKLRNKYDKLYAVVYPLHIREKIERLGVK